MDSNLIDTRETQPDKGLQAGFYRPSGQRNANRYLHQLFGKPVTILPEALLPSIALEEFPDISFYQGEVDFNILKTRCRAAIFRMGQATYKDPQFRRNWSEAKRVGLKRGVYWFYSGIASPQEQAAIIKELIGDDLPEMEIWVDWERSYGGAHEGLKNVVALMQLLDSMFPTCTVGMYTGYYWFIENSNPVTDFFRFQYLTKKPLWLAQYHIETQLVRIPRPWSKMRHHQYGTPVVGRAWGMKSLELDMNRLAESDFTFEQLYGGSIIIYPNNGDNMTTISPPEFRQVSTYKLQIRKGPSIGFEDIGDLWENDILTVVESRLVGTETWYRLSNASHNNQAVQTTDGRLVSQREDCWASGTYMRAYAPPAPLPEELHIDIDIVDGKIIGTVTGVAKGVPFSIRY